jgi:hypothetical protein
MLTEPADFEAELRKHPRMRATPAAVDLPAAGRGRVTTATETATATIGAIPVTSVSTTRTAHAMTAVMAAT